MSLFFYCLVIPVSVTLLFFTLLGTLALREQTSLREPHADRLFGRKRWSRVLVARSLAGPHYKVWAKQAPDPVFFDYSLSPDTHQPQTSLTVGFACGIDLQIVRKTLMAQYKKSFSEPSLSTGNPELDELYFVTTSNNSFKDTHQYAVFAYLKYLDKLLPLQVMCVEFCRIQGPAPFLSVVTPFNFIAGVRIEYSSSYDLDREIKDINAIAQATHVLAKEISRTNNTDFADRKQVLLTSTKSSPQKKNA